nr:MAG TPA: hypothetical protein [Caudoviricetes sp.]
MANIKHNTEKTNTKIKYILNQSSVIFFLRLYFNELLKYILIIKLFCKIN